jgi:hypothetical protein
MFGVPHTFVAMTFGLLGKKDATLECVTSAFIFANRGEIKNRQRN